MSDLRTFEAHKDKKKPWLLRQRSSRTFILITICVAIFTDAVLYGIIVPILPFSLRERSHVPKDEVQWWTSAIFAIYGAAILVGSPICGWFADRTVDRQTPLYAGLSVLAIATVGFGVAKAAWILAISRLLQGLSSAVVYSVGLAILVDTVGRDEIGQWMGTALSSSSFGLIVSPLLGGLIYAQKGYTAVFGLAIGLIGVDIALRFLMIEKKTAAKYEKKPGRDFQNSYGTTENHCSQVSTRNIHDEGVEEGENTPILNSHHSSTRDHEEVGNVAKDCLGQGHPSPMVILLRSPRLWAALYGIFINVSVLAAFDGTLPLFVKRTFGWNSLQAGLIFFTLAVPALSGPLVGRLSDKLGPRWIAVSGFTLTTPLLILLRLIDHADTKQEVLLCILLTLIGFSLVLIISPLAADISFVVQQVENDCPEAFVGLHGGAYAQAYALFNSSMAAASLFGPTFGGALVEKFGWKSATLALGIVTFSGNIPTILFAGSRVDRNHQSVPQDNTTEATDHAEQV